MFNINILPIHLVYGRNLGDLPGLKVHTAPKNAERTRANDLFISLISIENGKVSAETLASWNALIAENYFKARGSFTMGFTAAVRVFAAFIAKEFSGREAPKIFLNLAVIRDRVMLIGHSGPVTTTVVCSDHVNNFSDLSSEGLNQSTEGLRYFQVELHSGDIIFMSPFVPPGWTNQSILEAMSSSPLNVIRYLLDQANGNLECAVIQVKIGHGEINYRVKAPLIAKVDLGADADEEKVYNPTPDEFREIEKRIRSAEENSGPRADSPAQVEPKSGARPLFRLRIPVDPFPFSVPKKSESEREKERREQLEEMGRVKIPVFIGESERREEDDTDKTPKRDADEKPLPAQSARERVRTSRAERRSEREDSANSAKERKSRKRFPIRRVLTVLLLSILIPLIVGAGLVGLYVSRSNRSAYRVNLSGALSTAKVAAAQTDPTLRRVSWEKVLEYLDEAKKYGSSKAEKELRAQAKESLDKLENGAPIRYYYGLASLLPPGTNLIKLEAAGRFLYGLDETTGAVLRFTRSETGFAADPAFSCRPGTYSSFSAPEDKEPISVGKLVDFAVLPIENALDRLLIGVDRNANLLYCSQNLSGAADSIESPAEGWGAVRAVQFENRRLYLLDSEKNAIQSVPYIGKTGVGLIPETYFGTQGPPLYDVADFKILNTDVYLLRENGGLISCDYKGYVPVCSFADSFSAADGNRTIPIIDRGLFSIRVNEAPDSSLYLFDRDSQSIVNVTLKLNLVRYIVPDRFRSDCVDEIATAFVFFDRSTPVWAAGDRLFVGTLP